MRGWHKDVGKVTETKRHAPCAIAEKGVTREVLITSRFGRHFLRGTRMPYAVSILRRNVPLDDHSHVDWGWMAPLESEKTWTALLLLIPVSEISFSSTTGSNSNSIKLK